MVELWKISPKMGVIIYMGVEANIFFMLSVIVRSLVYLIIWFTLDNFVCLYYVPWATVFTLLLKKAFCFSFVLAIFVLIVFPSEMYFFWKKKIEEVIINGGLNFFSKNSLKLWDHNKVIADCKNLRKCKMTPPRFKHGRVS